MYRESCKLLSECLWSARIAGFVQCDLACLQTTGDLTIVSDSAFEVMNWTYTGMAPSVHWVSAMSTSPADLE